MNQPLIVIVGPTASGKTHRAVALAQAMQHCEIVSGDSRQVYTGMDIGTGKDLDEYQDIPYHLIDILPAGQKYNLYRFLSDYQRADTAIRARGNRPILCGGTGLYIESVLKGLTLPEVPENAALRARLKGKTLAELTEMLAAMKTLHNTTDVDTAQRAIRAIEIETYYAQHPEVAEAVKNPQPLSDAVIIGIDIDVDTRRQRITQRLKSRLADGMLDEVRRLLDMGIPAEALIYYGLEYKFVTLHLIGQLSYDEMFNQLEIAIHQFAKRQMTWFRGMQRRGFDITWIDYNLDDEAFIVQALEAIYHANK